MRVLVFFACGLISVCASAVCTVSPRVDLKAEPQVRSKTTWTVGKYTPLLEVERQGGWMKVKDQDGEHHWVQRAKVSTEIDCLSAANKKLYLRLGPGENAKAAPLKFVDKYTPFRKLDRDMAWLKIQDDFGMVYWVIDSHVWEPLRRSRIEFKE